MYCTPLCRNRGPREPHERGPIDEAQITRLFDSSREPALTARSEDWHPHPPLGFFELNAGHTVETRRRWYETLREEGML